MNETEDYHPTTDDPDRLVAALREYQAALDAGGRPNRREFLARYPDVAAVLAECLDGLDFVHAAAPRLKPADETAPPPAPVGPDGTLGDFRLVREIGRGGMGVVYEAVQISLARRVALKVLPFAATLDARQLRRFENEARAAAQLHHTNIVPVHAVGCERGVHYYAMQLIDGRPLSDVIDHLRQAPRTAPQSAATAPVVGSLTRRSADDPTYFRTVAGLAVQAAEALEYAHQMGVVHRDVKPGNLILDGRDHLWVTDFGLARFQAGPGTTAPGDLVGTLRYMSPEQAVGDPAIDPRSDVYSLGATLYELLTLTPAVPGTDQRTCLRQIVEDEPVPPRTINRSVPAELELIVLKAMAKAPADRYASARALADDLRRFLDHRPVQARRPSVFDQARKWVRRHPATVGAAVVVLVVAAVGLAAFGVFAAREQARTADALDREKQRAAEAEQRFQLARRSVDDMIQIGEEELVGSPETARARRRLLERSLAYYQEFIELRKDDPTAQAELAATRDRVQRIVADLALLQGMWRHLLLTEPEVQDDLALSGGQRTAVKAMLDQIGRPPGPPGEFRRRAPAELIAEVKAHEDAITALLTPGQLRRLDQIALQSTGPAAFREPEIVNRLKLTAEQRDRIRGIEAEAFIGMGDRGRRGPGGPRKEPGGPGFQVAMERILAVLTPEQRAIWKELTGEPYAGPLPRRPFGPPFRPFGPPDRPNR